MIALALATSILVSTLSASNTGVNPPPTTPDAGSAPSSGVEPVSLTLHTTQFVEGVIHDSLILPNATKLGPSYRILGAMVYGAVNLTATNGNQWNVLIYIANQSVSASFVNGTTTSSGVVNAGGVQITEAGPPPGVTLNSTAYAEANLAPTVFCSGKGMNPTPAESSCTTYSYTGQGYIVTENGLSLFANPQPPRVSWMDDRNRVAVNLSSETETVQQLLGLANTMTAPSASQ
jgi:hypothetical protein